MSHKVLFPLQKAEVGQETEQVAFQYPNNPLQTYTPQTNYKASRESTPPHFL